MLWCFRSSTGAKTPGLPPARSLSVLRLLALVLLVIPLGACAMFGFKEDVPPDEPAEKLYNEGVFLLNQKSEYKSAAKKFEEVERQHPYSEWARKALIMTAYARYEGREYDDAVTAARRYVSLHPSSPDAAYAQFLIGSAYYDQIPDVSRDQARAERAITALEEVSRKFPTTEYAVAAKQKVAMARDQLAGKEMTIGRYYMHK